MRNLFRELRRRRVFRSAGIYIVGAWVLLQVVALAFQSFDVSDSNLRWVWLALVAFFPLALILFWRYDLTAEGIQRTPPMHAADSVDVSLKTPDFLILGALVAVGAIMLGTAARQLNEDVRTATGPWYEGGPGIERIVVLPLENLSVDSDQDYLAAGFHDALIATLARINRFRVTSRFSTMRLEPDATIESIRERLGADKILSGSVARDGDTVRVNVSLLDAETQESLWSESFTRELVGLLDVQKEVASSVAREVQLTLTPDEQRRLTPGENPDAKTYEAYLRGMAQLRRGNRRSYRAAIEILTEAVENAPTNALAYAGLAIAYAQLGHSPFPVAGAYPRSREAAERAIEFDPDLPEAYLAIGMYKMYYEWDFAGSEAAFQQALDLNPSLVDAHYHYAWLLELLKRDEEAINYGEYSVELNPLSPFYAAWLAEQYRDANRQNEAITLANTVIGLNPNYPISWLVLGQAHLDLGEFEKAIAAHERLRNDAFWGYAWPATLAAAGRTEEALQAKQDLESKESNAFTQTLVLAGLGDSEAAINAMERAREEKIPWYPWLVNWFPQTAVVRDNPAVVQLAADLDIPIQASESFVAD